MAIYRPKDAFYLKAKKEGYRSRASYKLLELNRRFHLIRPGDRVVDLGAAPGGWLQVAAELVGPMGKVIGIDLEPVEALGTPNVYTIRGDIASEDGLRKLAELLESPADCILSDLSPRLSGIREADVMRSVELGRAAFRVACRLLSPGGNFLLKTFVGEDADAFFVELKSSFRSVQRTRPEATRKGSSEIYFCAKGFQKDFSAERDRL